MPMHEVLFESYVICGSLKCDSENVEFRHDLEVFCSFMESYSLQ